MARGETLVAGGTGRNGAERGVTECRGTALREAVGRRRWGSPGAGLYKAGLIWKVPIQNGQKSGQQHVWERMVKGHQGSLQWLSSKGNCFA